MEKKTGKIEGKVIITSTGGEINDGYGFHILYPRGIMFPNWSKVDINWDSLKKDNIKESKRIFSELDPYGEENWNE